MNKMDGKLPDRGCRRNWFAPSGTNPSIVATADAVQGWDYPQCIELLGNDSWVVIAAGLPRPTPWSPPRCIHPGKTLMPDGKPLACDLIGPRRLDLLQSSIALAIGRPGGPFCVFERWTPELSKALHGKKWIGNDLSHFAAWMRHLAPQVRAQGLYDLLVAYRIHAPKLALHAAAQAALCQPLQGLPDWSPARQWRILQALQSDPANDPLRYLSLLMLDEDVICEPNAFWCLDPLPLRARALLAAKWTRIDTLWRLLRARSEKAEQDVFDDTAKGFERLCFAQGRGIGVDKTYPTDDLDEYEKQFVQSCVNFSDSRGRVRATYDIKAPTLRASASQPPVQACPRSLQKSFWRAEKGYGFLRIDYHAVDLRMAAMIAARNHWRLRHEPEKLGLPDAALDVLRNPDRPVQGAWLQAFRQSILDLRDAGGWNDRPEDDRLPLLWAFREGLDVHLLTALWRVKGMTAQDWKALDRAERQRLESEMTEARRRAKTENFGLLYGMSAETLAQTLREQGYDCDEESARQSCRLWMQRYAEIALLRATLTLRARPWPVIARSRPWKMGHVWGARTLGGRRVWSHSAGTLLNYMTQGSVSEMVWHALSRLPCADDLVLFRHDEFIFEMTPQAGQKWLHDLPAWLSETAKDYLSKALPALPPEVWTCPVLAQASWDANSFEEKAEKHR